MKKDNRDVPNRGYGLRGSARQRQTGWRWTTWLSLSGWKRGWWLRQGRQKRQECGVVGWWGGQKIWQIAMRSGWGGGVGCWQENKDSKRRRDVTRGTSADGENRGECSGTNVVPPFFFITPSIQTPVHNQTFFFLKGKCMEPFKCIRVVLLII